MFPLVFIWGGERRWREMERRGEERGGAGRGREREGEGGRGGEREGEGRIGEDRGG
jgi:hypothetical protein